MLGFILLNDPASPRQWIIRGEHVCAAEARREDGAVTLCLLNGEKVHLTPEESRQFIRHTHPLRAQGAERLRDLAYRKWEEAGRPPGDGKGFWHEAERELLRISRLIRPQRRGDGFTTGAATRATSVKVPHEEE